LQVISNIVGKSNAVYYWSAERCWRWWWDESKWDIGIETSESGDRETADSEFATDLLSFATLKRTLLSIFCNENATCSEVPDLCRARRHF
jgi:hypothetical protein